MCTDHLNTSCLPYPHRQKKLLKQYYEDTIENKRKLAFKPFSFSRKIDVGIPPFCELTKSELISDFRKLYIKCQIPLKYTRLLNNDSIIWTAEMDYELTSTLIPICIEGICDSQDKFQRIAYTAAKDLICFTNSEFLIKWLPTFIESICKCVRTLRCNTISRLLCVLDSMIHRNEYIASNILPYFIKIFKPLSYFFRKDKFNELINKDENKEFIMLIRQDIWKFFQHFERNCWPNELNAFYHIRDVLPIYESVTFCDVRPIYEECYDYIYIEDILANRRLYKFQ